MIKVYLDIETKPNICYTWGLFNQNIGLEQIVEPGATLCWAAKVERNGKMDKKIQFKSVFHDGHEDMVAAAHALLDEADVIVHYNGQSFDIPILNKEFVAMSLAPPTTYQQIDLLQTARHRFKFASNKLDFVSQFLGLGAKHQHKGMALWTGCMNNVKADWKLMKEYNIQDVELLPVLYGRLLPWINNHPNMALFTDEERPVCTNCGSAHVHCKGVERLSTQSYTRFKCVDCGTNLRSRYTALPLEKRKTVLTQSKL